MLTQLKKLQVPIALTVFAIAAVSLCSFEAFLNETNYNDTHRQNPVYLFRLYEVLHVVMIALLIFLWRKNRNSQDDSTAPRTFRAILIESPTEGRVVPVIYRAFLYTTIGIFALGVLAKASELPIEAFSFLPQVVLRMALELLAFLAVLVVAFWLNGKLSGTPFNPNFGWKKRKPHITRN